MNNEKQDVRRIINLSMKDINKIENQSDLLPNINSKS